MEKAVPPIGAVDPSVTGAARPTIEQLVADHHEAAYRYAFRLAGSAADAEDLTQQAFLLAHQRLDQLREPEHAAAWLLTIVRNCFLKTLRRRTNEAEPLSEEPAQLQEELPDWIDPERLEQALARLPDEARTILMMFFFEECSYKSIAEALEVPIGTVMSRLSRAKARLRSELQASGERLHLRSVSLKSKYMPA